MNNSTFSINKLSFLGVVISLGIVFGDIGTSPLYVMKAILSGASNPDANFILGSLSCIIWTLTLQTTIKYVLITLRADNKGEGGIFALFALVKKWSKWAFIPALIGGSALLADGIITPSITIVSAVEGLKIFNPNIPIIPIAITIITILFLAQQLGTNKIGVYFGPIMFIWFITLGTLGISQILTNPYVLHAFNPVYAFHFLTSYKHGFILLGAVFLCTTGAEALYSDLGHCGIKNIRVSWMFVKLMLILNYLGQGAWIINNISSITSSINPFYAIMPQWFLFTGIILATMAAIIASQALITGSFTIISEAIRLNLWPKVLIKYPSTIKGQMYIPSTNWFLWASCVFVVLYFQESSAMEAAYGLSITVTMIMTTLLIMSFMQTKRIPLMLISLFVIVYLFIEGAFLIANLFKFFHGGWITILLAGIMFLMMYVWAKGREIRGRFVQLKNMKEFQTLLSDVSADNSIPRYATNLVYLTASNAPEKIEAKVIYSIINKQPKRADNYWFLHVNFLDIPYCLDYKITTFEKNIFRIDINLGFKEQPKINAYFRFIIEEMVKAGEVDISSRYDSLKKHKKTGDFKFVVIDRVATYDFHFNTFETIIINIFELLRKMSISESKEMGLDTSNIVTESVPLGVPNHAKVILNRLD